MKSPKRWAPPGWPWELEILVLVFFLAALAMPYYLHYKAPAKSTQELSLVEMAQLEKKNPVDISMDEQRGIVWALVIIGLYAAHMILAMNAIEFNSTPFSHLLSPAVFAMFAYYRTHTTAVDLNQFVPLVNGHPLEIAVILGSVLVLTFVLARLRMSRHLLRFRDIQWDISKGSSFDKSYLTELSAAFRPLIYPPRKYRACSEGIMIIGWLYIMPIPFKAINSMVRTPKAKFVSSGYWLATNTKNLARLQLTDHPEPVFISPNDPEAFVSYCNPYTQSSANTTRAGGTSGGDSKGGTQAIRLG